MRRQAIQAPTPVFRGLAAGVPWPACDKSLNPSARMPVATISEAAAALGFRSRSTLYRLKNEGQLSAYLRPPASTGGAERLELEPSDLPPLREHVARLIRLQRNNADRQQARPRTDSRWGVVAGALTEALADCGGLQLTGPEALAVAAALPAALSEAFGAEGLEWLRLRLADAGCWRAGPPAPDVAALAEWWGADGWGRWAPGEPLEDGPFWEHVGAIVGGMMGGPFAGLTGPNAHELRFQLEEAIDAVEAGARWDQARWDAETARLLLADLAGDPEDDQPAAELAQLLEAGRLPDDLAEQARNALAASEARGYLAWIRVDPGDCAEAVAALLQLLEAGRLPEALADEVRAALAQAEQQAAAALPVVVGD